MSQADAEARRLEATHVRNVIRALTRWFEAHGRHDLPWRVDVSPYRVLVSELMLQQTQVSRVIAYFERWMKRFPDLQALADASSDEVMRAWQGLGYYRRARALKSVADHLAQLESMTLPQTLAELKALPGVGPYTAQAILAFAHDRKAAALDTNLKRVLGRIFIDLLDPSTLAPAELRAREVEAERVMLLACESASPRVLNSALMDLGAMVCSARAPQCSACPLRTHCKAFAAGGPEIAAKAKAVKRAAPVRAMGVLREGKHARLPARAGLFSANLADGIKARAALQADALKRFGIEIAVRPAYTQVKLDGVETSLHRCTLLIGDASRFPLATKKRIARLTEDQARALELLKLKAVD